MKLLFLCVVLFLGSSLAALRKGYTRTVSYKGEILVRCRTESPAVQSFLKNDYVDIWGLSPDGRLDIRVKESLYETAGVASECSVVDDIEHIVQMSENVTSTGAKAEWFEEYHRYDEIINWYQDLQRMYPQLVTYNESIGKSVEGRDQPAVRIKGSEGTKNIIYFQCQIHAREWISGATCMYIANHLVENFGRDEVITDLLNSVEFVFVPFVNPDGYEYTWTNDRLWRKNRQINEGSVCDGVDLNRNYNDHWNEGGSSSNPCSETYHGEEAESEPETKNTANYFKSLGNIVGAIDWHSYSQLILRPYGWTNADCPDEDQLRDLGSRMRTDILRVHGQEYTSQKSVGLYPTSGTASDWFYSNDANINNENRAAGFTIELRDTGRYGFQLPADQIIPQGEEMIPAVIQFALELNGNPLEK